MTKADTRNMALLFSSIKFNKKCMALNNLTREPWFPHLGADYTKDVLLDAKKTNFVFFTP